MPINDFKPFACAPGANVLTQSQWLAFSQLGTGFSSGVVPSAGFNKGLRQSSLMASAIAQLTSDRLTADVLDGGDAAALKTLLAKGQSVGEYGLDIGSTNVIQVAYPVTFTSVNDGMQVKFRAANNNTGPTTLTVNGMAAQPILNGIGAALSGSEILQNGIYSVIWNNTLAAWIIQNPASSSAAQGAAQSITMGATFSAGTIYTVASLVVPKTGKISASVNGGWYTSSPIASNTFGGLVIGLKRNATWLCNSDIPFTMNTGDGLVLAGGASNAFADVVAGDTLSATFQVVIGRGDTVTTWTNGGSVNYAHANELNYHYIK